MRIPISPRLALLVQKKKGRCFLSHSIPLVIGLSDAEALYSASSRSVAVGL